MLAHAISSTIAATSVSAYSGFEKRAAQPVEAA